MQKPIGWLLSFLVVWQGQVCCVSATNAGDALTPQEKRAAIALADAFTKKWEESGDMRKIVESLYASDCVERFLAEEKLRIAQDARRFPNQEKNRLFITGIEYQPNLLEQVSPDDWRSLYVNFSEIVFYMGTHLTNQMAGSLLQGKDTELDPNSIERIIPAKMREELGQHPILKNFIKKQTNAKPIATVAEMKEVIALLEKTKTQIRQVHGSSVYQPTQAARKVTDILMKSLGEYANVERNGEERFLLPSGARMILMPTKLGHYLVIAEINGQFKILWTIPITK